MRRRDRARPLATRVLVGIALAVLGLACLWAGTWAFAGLVAVTAALAWREWLRLYQLWPAGPLDWWTRFNELTFFPLSILFANMFGFMWVIGYWVFFAAIIQTASRNPKPWTLGYFYIGLPALGLVWLDSLPDGRRWIEWTVGIVCAADIAAFACGRLIGGPKLWPRLSPNKTWAGFMGALVAAALASAALGGAVGIAALPALALGFALGGLAMGGDLFESWMKRRVGAKDSGSILPGHGGVLDRLDGLVPVATVVAGGVWAMGL